MNAAVDICKNTYYNKCSVKEIWEVCRRLNNPERLGLLRQVYESKDGLNVGLAIDGVGLNQSGTSQYLKQLEDLGLIRRERAGRFVNYYADLRNANDRIRELGEMLMERFRSWRKNDLSFTDIFPAMMNARRARIVAYLSTCQRASGDEIAERFNFMRKHVVREMKPIIECSLAIGDGDGLEYIYVPPKDEIARAIVRLSL